MDRFCEDGFLFDDAKLHELAQIGARSAALVHDVNNLLQVAMGNLDLIALHPLDDATRKRLSRARASLTKCAGMMCANPGRANEGGSVCVSRFVAENIDFFKDVCGPGIKLSVEDGSKDVRIRADERRLESALINLLVNARDAMNGVGRVSIVYSLICDDRHQVLRLCVADDGPGIPRDIQATVFSRFFKTKSAGSGMGLANVRQFVDDSGGTVRLESPSGRGTSVSMFFPILPDTKACVIKRWVHVASQPAEFYPPETPKGALL